MGRECDYGGYGGNNGVTQNPHETKTAVLFPRLKDIDFLRPRPNATVIGVQCTPLASTIEDNWIQLKCKYAMEANVRINMVLFQPAKYVERQEETLRYAINSKSILPFPSQNENDIMTIWCTIGIITTPAFGGSNYKYTYTQRLFVHPYRIRGCESYIHLHINLIPIYYLIMKLFLGTEKYTGHPSIGKAHTLFRNQFQLSSNNERKW